LATHRPCFPPATGVGVGLGDGLVDGDGDGLVDGDGLSAGFGDGLGDGDGLIASAVPPAAIAIAPAASSLLIAVRK
jgi:hypothetical protein